MGCVACCLRRWLVSAVGAVDWRVAIVLVFLCCVLTAVVSSPCCDWSVAAPIPAIKPSSLWSCWRSTCAALCWRALLIVAALIAFGLLLLFFLRCCLLWLWSGRFTLGTQESAADPKLWLCVAVACCVFIGQLCLWSMSAVAVPCSSAFSLLVVVAFFLADASVACLGVRCLRLCLLLSVAVWCVVERPSRLVAV